MKTPRRAAFRWLALPLALAVSLALAQAPVVERPTLTKGDRWVLGEGAFELVRVERDAYVFALPADGREIHLSRDLAPGAFLRRGVADWQLRPAPSLPWPLRVGKWGVGVGQLRLRSEFDPIPVRVTWQVEAYEQIKVPAGTLGAFRIAYRLDLDGVGTGGGGLRGGRNSWSVTTWYAPAVQRLARAQFIGATGLDFELAALEPPATSPAPSPPSTVAKPGRARTGRAFIAARCGTAGRPALCHAGAAPCRGQAGRARTGRAFIAARRGTAGRPALCHAGAAPCRGQAGCT